MSEASAGVRAERIDAPGTIRFTSFDSTSPGPASTNVLAPASAKARIERGIDSDLVRSPARGRLGGVLGRDGEPVKPGQAVAWMEPV